MTRLGVPKTRLHVIPPGIGHFASHFTHADKPVSTGADGGAVGSRPPHILYVGSIFNRRHVTDHIRAFAPIARLHPDTQLDIVGDNRSYPHEDLSHTVTAEGLDRQVRLHQYVTDAALRDLYARARAFAFLSEYEGLGLTPLEALAAGVPPVLLDTPVAHETCGRAALYVAPRDLRATTEALEKALYDERVHAELLAAAPATLAKYSWLEAGRETLRVLNEVASGRL
jgi:glycosyltransferase involved in cell wall biosynthesis